MINLHHVLALRTVYPGTATNEQQPGKQPIMEEQAAAPLEQAGKDMQVVGRMGHDQLAPCWTAQRSTAAFQVSGQDRSKKRPSMLR
jgi:hypothetical protein